MKVRKEELQCSDRSKKDRLCYRVAELIPEQDYVIDVAAYTENGGWSDWSQKLTARTHDQGNKFICFKNTASSLN